MSSNSDEEDRGRLLGIVVSGDKRSPRDTLQFCSRYNFSDIFDTFLREARTASDSHKRESPVDGEVPAGVRVGHLRVG